MANAMVSSVLEKLVFSIEVQKLLQQARQTERLEKLSKILEAIEAVAEDADQRQVREQSVRFWLDQLKEAAYDLEGVLDGLNTALLKSRQNNTVVSSNFSSPSQVVLLNDFSLKIRNLNERFDEIAMRKEKFGFEVNAMNREGMASPSTFVSSFCPDCDDTYSLGNEKRRLIDMLFSKERKIPHIISIVGMEATGKTTLAKLAYNSYEVIRYFNLRIWVRFEVSVGFDELRIAKSITEALDGSGLAFSSKELQPYLEHISKSIVGKRFILVLDNVAIELCRRLEPLVPCVKNGLPGSKILITTQNESVARGMESTHIITRKKVPEEAYWSLFKLFAFRYRSVEECENLEEIGRKIVAKCNGLSLVIKIIGSALCFKRIKQEWQNILDSKMLQLDEIRRRHFVPLRLSYNNLPSIIRICFLYCAIFPKDYPIYRDTLIKLWMSQGYTVTEATGQWCFDQLVKRCWFQELEFEEDGNDSIIRCKMPDLVHDFVQFLAKNDNASIEDGGDVEEPRLHKLRHLFLMVNKGISFPISVSRVKGFRSLLIHYGATNCSSVSEVLPKLLEQSTSLRALDISGQLRYGNVIIKIPKEITKLVFLRYLNLSLLNIDELPEDLYELWNLQTLELNWCTNLKKLPEGMGKLINSRHLLTVGTSLCYMPRGIERLTRLQTLSEFVVSSGGKTCTLECLKSLNNLQGSLSIQKLRNVTDVSEVVEAKLEHKLNLLGLYLTFENDAEEGRMKNDDEFLEAMQPPKSLQRLEIRDYKGKSIPSWIMLSSKLRILSLHNCSNCENLPPLGKLPALESLIYVVWRV